MRRRSLAVLGGLMMTTGALLVVAPASLGVAPAPTTLGPGHGLRPALRRGLGLGPDRPVPIRSLTAALPGGTASRGTAAYGTDPHRADPYGIARHGAVPARTARA